MHVTMLATMERVGRLLGTQELSVLLGVNRARVYQLSQKPGFPAPRDVLGAGNIWWLHDIEDWAHGRGRTLHPEALTVIVLADPGQDGPLVATQELSRLLGVGRQRVYQLSLKPGFPRAMDGLGIGKLWWRHEVEQWAKHTGRPLHPGALTTDVQAGDDSTP